MSDPVSPRRSRSVEHAGDDRYSPYQQTSGPTLRGIVRCPLSWRPVVGVDPETSSRVRSRIGAGRAPRCAGLTSFAAHSSSAARRSADRFSLCATRVLRVPARLACGQQLLDDRCLAGTVRKPSLGRIWNPSKSHSFRCSHQSMDHRYGRISVDNTQFRREESLCLKRNRSVPEYSQMPDCQTFMCFSLVFHV